MDCCASVNLARRRGEADVGVHGKVVAGVVESIKIITRNASMRVAKYAFHYAQLHGRKRVSAIHKANIMKKTDGLFLEVLICLWGMKP